MTSLKAAIVGRINFNNNFLLSARDDDELMTTPPSSKHLVSGKGSEIGTGKKKILEKKSEDDLPMRYRMLLAVKAPVHDK
jgi:hypothetical protein